MLKVRRADACAGRLRQVAGFLSAVLCKSATADDKTRAFPLPQDDCRMALVVVPATTLSNWERELRTWGWFKVACALQIAWASRVVALTTRRA